LGGTRENPNPGDQHFSIKGEASAEDGIVASFETAKTIAAVADVPAGAIAKS
jgi:hypothetical protein